MSAQKKFFKPALRKTMTDSMHPVIQQITQIRRVTERSYGMLPPPAPRPPEEVRQELAKHPAQPVGSADAI